LKRLFFYFLKPVLKPGDKYLVTINLNKRMFTMKNKFAFLVSSIQKIDRRHTQLVLTLIALTLLVLGVGAPNSGGGGG
jgi:hypothetical protein